MYSDSVSMFYVAEETSIYTKIHQLLFPTSISSVNSPLTLFSPSTFNLSSSPFLNSTCGINHTAKKNPSAANAAPTMKIIRNPFRYAGIRRARIFSDSDLGSLAR